MTSVLPVAAAIVVALLLGSIVRRRLWFVVEVESDSMASSLAPGQRLLVRRSHPTRPPARGDIVVVHSAELGRRVVKRLVGLPGEHVDVSADGRVRVDGRELAEPYVRYRDWRSGSFDVPAGHVLLLGDNRARSSDARAWREPCLPLSAVLGRVVRPGPWSTPRGVDRP